MPQKVHGNGEQLPKQKKVSTLVNGGFPIYSATVVREKRSVVTENNYVAMIIINPHNNIVQSVL